MGAFLLASSYFLIARGRIQAASYAYHITNLAGALLISANTFYFDAIGPALLNVICSLIAFYYLIKIWRNHL